MVVGGGCVGCGTWESHLCVALQQGGYVCSVVCVQEERETGGCVGRPRESVSNHHSLVWFRRQCVWALTAVYFSVCRARPPSVLM